MGVPARTEDDDTRRSIANLFILRTAELNHGLCGWVCNLDFSKNGISIVCQAAIQPKQTERERASASHGLVTQK